jgi:hypothetical protein
MNGEAMLDAFRKHNKPLKKAMEDNGFLLVHRDGKTYFVDKNGEYQSYPVGYITGPSSCEQGYYVSVKGRDGWAQRTFKADRTAQTAEWALERAKEALNEEPQGDANG